MVLRDITLKDVEDLFDMEGDRFDVLVATAQRAKQIHEAEERAAAAAAEAINQPPRRRSERAAAASRRRIAIAARRREVAPQPPLPPPPLPEAFRHAIEEMARGRAATPAALVIQKCLYFTDVSSNHNRLSIPMSQIRDDFLTETEKRRLDRSYLEVRIVEPSAAAVAAAKFNRWDMEKGEGKKKSSSYVINGKWNEIVERNGLELDMVVQLWCFRIDGDLCFAVVRLPPRRDGGAAAVAGDAA